MPTFARSGSGKWHVVGPDGCRYGRELAADTNSDKTVSATDIIAYEPPPDPEEAERMDSISLSATGDSFPLGEPYQQRLVFPSTIEDSDVGVCGSCQSLQESKQKRRSK